MSNSISSSTDDIFKQKDKKIRELERLVEYLDNQNLENIKLLEEERLKWQEESVAREQHIVDTLLEQVDEVEQESSRVVEELKSDNRKALKTWKVERMHWKSEFLEKERELELLKTQIEKLEIQQTQQQEIMSIVEQNLSDVEKANINKLLVERQKTYFEEQQEVLRKSLVLSNNAQAQSVDEALKAKKENRFWAQRAWSLIVPKGFKDGSNDGSAEDVLGVDLNALKRLDDQHMALSNHDED